MLFQTVRVLWFLNRSLKTLHSFEARVLQKSHNHQLDEVRRVEGRELLSLTKLFEKLFADFFRFFA